MLYPIMVKMLSSTVSPTSLVKCLSLKSRLNQIQIGTGGDQGFSMRLLLASKSCTVIVPYLSCRYLKIIYGSTLPNLVIGSLSSCRYILGTTVRSNFTRHREILLFGWFHWYIRLNFCNNFCVFFIRNYKKEMSIRTISKI